MIKKKEVIFSSCYPLSRAVLITVVSFVCEAQIKYSSLVLMAFDILPFHFGGMPFITYGVLGAMFLVFIAVGVNSMKSAKAYKTEALNETARKEEILAWCKNTFSKNDIDAKILEEVSEEEMYFKRTEIMKQEIADNFPDLEDDFLDYLLDLVYPDVFEG